jgi:hypothetical protein
MIPSSVAAPDQRHRAHTHYQHYQRIPVTVGPTFQAFQSLFNSHDILLVVVDSIKNTFVATNRFISKAPHGKEKAPG